jgi:hypothetical protein
MRREFTATGELDPPEPPIFERNVASGIDSKSHETI